MLPLYLSNLHPATDDDPNLRPASRLEVQMQMLNYERQRYAAMQRGTYRHIANPVTAVTHAVRQAIASLAAVTRHLMPRHAAPAPGSHICIPGVDC